MGVQWITGPDGVSRPNYAASISGPISSGNQSLYSKNPYDINSQNGDERKRAQQYNESIDKYQTERAGAPTRPDFVSTLDGNGNIKSNYQLNPNTIANPNQVTMDSIMPGLSDKLNGINVDQRGINAVRDRALGTGDSPWLKLQMEKQGLDESNALQKSSASVAGSNANAESNLAMRGGISSGARERLARSGAMASNQAGQDVRNQGVQNRLNLQIADDQTKTGLLSQLPGMEIANVAPETAKQEYLGNMASTEQGRGLDTAFKNVANTTDTAKYNAGATTDAQKYNIGNALNDILQKRAYDTAGYSEDMKAWAAGKSADAQSSAGKK